MPWKERISRAKRIESLSCLDRLSHLLNFAEMARLTGTNRDTFNSRYRNNVDLTRSVDTRGFAAEVTDLMDEVYHELGQQLGYERRVKNKKVRYLRPLEGDTQEEPI